MSAVSDTATATPPPLPATVAPRQASLRHRLREFFRAAIPDNAMVYKDLTQWLRNKTFIALFFGLLLACEAISLGVMGIADEGQRPGFITFNLLFLLLGLYAMIVAANAHALTSREFVNHTFELYELAGMGLERMVAGKFLSMALQFGFGLACIAPFMFFAYFLGGLDFLEIAASLLLSLALVPPVYLAALQAALTMRIKSIAVLGRVAAVGMFFFFGVFGLMAAFSPSSLFGGALRSLGNLAKALTSGSGYAWLGLGVLVLFYIQLCGLLFYLCCNLIARENDSREVAVKGFCLSLAISWMGVILGPTYSWGPPPAEQPGLVLFPIFIALCLLGLMFYNGRASVPIIVQRRYENASTLRKLAYRLLIPGPRGYLRFIILILALSGVAAYLGYLGPTPTSGFSSSRYGSSSGAFTPMSHLEWGVRWLRQLSYIAQIPFFLVFPIGFVAAFVPKLRHQIAVWRASVATWWGLSGAVLLAYEGYANMNHAVWLGPVQFLCVIASPISSSLVGGNSYSLAGAELDFFMLLRFILGAVGLAFMRTAIARREAMETTAPLGNTESSIAETGAVA